jgi:Mg2+-importing ATPase
MAASVSNQPPPAPAPVSAKDFALLPPGQSVSDAWLQQAAKLSAPELLEKMQTSPAGLSWTGARERLEQYGHNVAVPHKLAPWPRVLWHAFCNPFNYILLFLGIVSWMTADPGDPVKGVPGDPSFLGVQDAALLMFTMIVVATGLRFWQEYRSQVKADVLRKMVRNLATVYRTENEGVERTPDSMDAAASEILMQDIAPGDIVKLSAGDMIPAECRLLESRDLFVSQSALTGEAMPVEKDARQGGNEGGEGALLQTPNLCFMGSSVVSGTAKAVVLATGPSTQMGALASKLVEQRPLTAFDIGINKVSMLLIKFMVVMVPIVILLNGLTKDPVIYPHRWLEAFMFGVAVAVGLVPEMLPMIVNTNLARGAVAMAKEKVVVKRINAIQNFGAMDVLCTDKTGTLTQDRVALIKHLDVHGEERAEVLEKAYLNSLYQSGLKNLIDRAVIEHARLFPAMQDAAQAFSRIDELPFDFFRRRMSVVIKPTSGSGPTLLICKGAVDEMLEICDHVVEEGRVVPLSDETAACLRQLRDDNNNDGLRLVGVAYKEVTKAAGEYKIADESGLIFSGYIAFLDPAKDSAAQALRLLREHGVAVKILTGDNALVARKVCHDVELDVEGVVVGEELKSWTPQDWKERIEHTTIFAKLTPSQKADVVRALKANGHTVGFMGDGINDSLALREADVGISVDTGVDIAKEAADIILLEKNLLVLERGVVWGRVTYGNIIKYIKMAASSNFGNVFSMLVASACLPFQPMLPVQILLQNLFYDFSQVGIPWDRMDEDWLKIPRRWAPGSIFRFMVCIGPISSIFDITTFLGMWYIFHANNPGGDLKGDALFQSAWFVEGLITQTLIVHMIRTEKIPFIQSRASTPVVLLTLVVIAAGCYLPFSPMAGAIHMVGLPHGYWPLLAATILGYGVLTQVGKHYFIKKFKEWM